MRSYSANRKAHSLYIHLLFGRMARSSCLHRPPDNVHETRDAHTQSNLHLGRQCGRRRAPSLDRKTYMPQKSEVDRRGRDRQRMTEQDLAAVRARRPRRYRRARAFTGTSRRRGANDQPHVRPPVMHAAAGATTSRAIPAWVV